MIKVYVEQHNPEIEQMFVNYGAQITKDLTPSVDLICFDGGADVSPWLYGEDNTHSQNDPVRDQLCIKIWEFAKEYDIPCAGICRGGQFLNVMNGGKMIQHFPGHGYDHSLTVLPEEYADYEGVEVTSTHHQVMIPREGASLIAVGDSVTEVEVLVYDDEVPCLCFQPHPEYTHATKKHTDFFFHLINNELLWFKAFAIGD